MPTDIATTVCIGRPSDQTLKDRLYCWCCGLSETEPELCAGCQRMSV